MILIYIFKFLTIWSFFLSLFHNYVNSYISLPFLSFICMIMGLYISYINPKKYVIYNYNKPIEIKNNLIKLLFIDIPFHILVFIFIIYKYGFDDIYDIKIITTLLLIFFYYSINDISFIYKISIKELQLLFIVAILLYILLFKIKLFFFHLKK